MTTMVAIRSALATSWCDECGAEATFFRADFRNNDVASYCETHKPAPKRPTVRVGRVHLHPVGGAA